MNKAELRDHYRTIRKNIPDKAERSKVICNKIINHPRYQESLIIGIYISKSEEVDLTPVIADALKHGKVVAVPRVKNLDLEFYKFDPRSTLIRSKFGVMEPNPACERIDIKDIPLFLVPGLSFDKNGNRLGFGNGFFDRALIDQDVYKIGICFKEQMQEDIPHYSYDVKMDEIIHE